MAQKVSMQQIADRLGVSKYTVSQALAGKAGVSESTRRQVLAMARALGYRTEAKEGVRGRAYAVGAADAASDPTANPDAGKALILAGLTKRHAEEPNFWQRVKQGIDAGCRERGYRVHYFTFGEGPESGSRSFHMELDEHMVRLASGIIMTGNCPVEALLGLKRSGLPLVLVDHEEPVAYTDAVLNANVEAGRMACHHLMSQGCSAIAFVGRDSYAVSFRERWWGCRIAIDDLNGRRTPGYAALRLDLAAVNKEEKPVVQLRKWTIPYGPSAWSPALARKLASAAAGDGLPAGFVCANDDIALELMRLLTEQGVAVPEVCRVVGIDNTAASSAAPVPITTVDLAKEWLGMRAVETLARRLERPEAPPEKVVLPARLIVRQSG